MFGRHITNGFVTRAKNSCPEEICLEDMITGEIPFNESFDLTYSIAVMAHILDEDMFEQSLARIAGHTKIGGHFLCFEATSSTRRSGEHWVRRSQEEYEKAANKAGFKLVEVHHCFYPIFTFYQHSILPLITKVIFKGKKKNSPSPGNSSPYLQKTGDIDALPNLIPVAS